MATTKEEFENYYAKNSKMTIKELKKVGLVAMPCDCRRGGCKGWQMDSIERLKLVKGQ